MSPRVFGVLNTTPDSFSDGNKFVSVPSALAHARELSLAGAHIIDVGGESTRPGATLVGAAEEQRRVIPVIRELVGEGLAVSVDTIRASTAEAAVLAGARVINDVSGGLFDPAMLDTVARLTANIEGVHYVIGHWRGVPDPEHQRSQYGDVVREVAAELQQRIEAALEVGIPQSQLVIDPGLGFDKTAEQCWELLRRVDELTALGYPLLIGASRKRMLAEIAPEGASAEARDLATAVVSALAARAGVWGVRVHDAASTTQALAVVTAWGANAQSAPSAQPAPNTPPAPTPQPVTTITLTGLEAFAHHGVYDFEREAGQPFVIDAVVHLLARDTVDDITTTVHYGELAEALVANVESQPVDLIETLAERLAELTLSFAGVHAVTITVHKPQAPISVPFADVSVSVERKRTA